MLPGSIGNDGSTSGPRVLDEREKKARQERQERRDAGEDSGFDVAVGRKSVSRAALSGGELPTMSGADLTTDPEGLRLSQSLKLRALSAAGSGSGPTPEPSSPSGSVTPVGYAGDEVTRITVLQKRLPEVKGRVRVPSREVNVPRATGKPSKPVTAAPAELLKADRSSSWDSGTRNAARALAPQPGNDKGGILGFFGKVVTAIGAVCKPIASALGRVFPQVSRWCRRLSEAAREVLKAIWAARQKLKMVNRFDKKMNRIEASFAKARAAIVSLFTDPPKVRPTGRVLLSVQVLHELGVRVRRYMVYDPVNGDHVVVETERLGSSDAGGPAVAAPAVGPALTPLAKKS